MWSYSGIRIKSLYDYCKNEEKEVSFLTEHGDQNVDVIEPDLCQQWKHLGDTRFYY